MYAARIGTVIPDLYDRYLFVLVLCVVQNINAVVVFCQTADCICSIVFDCDSMLFRILTESIRCFRFLQYIGAGLQILKTDRTGCFRGNRSLVNDGSVLGCTGQ